jgi:hypothetical protein
VLFLNSVELWPRATKTRYVSYISSRSDHLLKSGCFARNSNGLFHRESNETPKALTSAREYFEKMAGGGFTCVPEMAMDELRQQDDDAQDLSKRSSIHAAKKS